MVREYPLGFGVLAAPVFVFFSNQLGCLPSLFLSAVVTAILLIVFGVVDL